MGDEVKLETIQKTQQVLGKFVKKPPLTDKLLKKPPFRFLHDVITAVISNTGFLAGLYTAEELQSENVKDREAKIKFLQKLISTVQIVTGLELTARPSKIIAGHEPEKTNELLQAIGKALQKKLNSDSAVAQMNEGKTLSKESKPPKEKEKSKKPVQSPPKKTEKESSKLTKDPTKKRSDSTSRIPNATPRDNKTNVKEIKSTAKKSTSKTNLLKQKDVDKKRSKENKTKLDLQLVDPNNIQDHFIEEDSVKNDINKDENIKIDVEQDHQSVAQNATTIITDVMSKELQENNTNVSLNDKENINTEERQSAKLQRPKSSKRGREIKPKIEQIDISDTESNQLTDKIDSDINLTEKDESKNEKRPSTRTSHSSRIKILETNAEPDIKVHSESESKHNRQKSALKSDNSVEVSEKITNNSLPSNETQILRSAKRERSIQNVSQPVVETIGDTDTMKETKLQNKETALEMSSKSDSSKAPLIRPRTSLRPPSARPSSARPAAPRVRDKTDVIVPPEQMVTLGKVNVIVENFSTNDNDEEEESLVVVESASDIPDIDLAPQQNNSLTENESMQGHLVAQILETQKELIDDIGSKSTPVEIEWEADGQRNREAKKRDIESLRSKIQTVTRAAHPLGQIINYLQEDYDNLLRELKQWQNENEKLNKEIEEQNSKSDQMVSPLTNQFEEIKDEIQKQQERNAMIKADIFRNQRKIDSLLSGII